MKARGLLALAVLGLSAPARADVFVRDDIITDPAPDGLTVCYGNGCLYLGHVSLTPPQWQEVVALFQPPAASAAEEREQLRRAIAKMESLTGAKMESLVGAATGTWRDKGGTFNGGEGQMDCIDESINTTLYLTLFRKYGLMRHHRVEDRATRGWFLAGWPHTSAVVSEVEGGRRWAVDSWFLDNGEPPFILPLEVWKSGWRPAHR